MAISTSFFLVYSAQKIKTEKLEKKPVSIRAQVRYTRSAMAWSIAKRMGHQVERLQFTIPAKAQPRYWANGKVHHNHPDAQQINNTIDTIAARAAELHAQFIAAGAFPDPAQFIAQILQATPETPTQSQSTFFSHYNQYLQFLKDQNTPPKPIENQRRICAILLRFQTETGYQINYNSINRTFAARFITWAANTLPKRRSGQNIRITAERYITDLKHFLNHAHREEWTTATTWRQIKSTRQPRKFPITITDDEIQQLAAITADQLPARTDIRAGLANTLDWFIFATQTGLRWSDWQTRRIQIITHTPNIINIRITTEKTDQPLEIPLTNLAVQILQRNGGQMPPGYPYTTTSRHLRRIARIAGIQKHLTTHTARRTFCTTQEAAGVPRAYIMRITGHRHEADYLRYTGITYALNADLMRRANPAAFTKSA